MEDIYNGHPIWMSDVNLRYSSQSQTAVTLKPMPDVTLMVTETVHSFKWTKTVLYSKALVRTGLLITKDAQFGPLLFFLSGGEGSQTNIGSQIKIEHALHDHRELC